MDCNFLELLKLIPKVLPPSPTWHALDIFLCNGRTHNPLTITIPLKLCCCPSLFTRRQHFCNHLIQPLHTLSIFVNPLMLKKLWVKCTACHMYRAMQLRPTLTEDVLHRTDKLHWHHASPCAAVLVKLFQLLLHLKLGLHTKIL